MKEYNLDRILEEIKVSQSKYNEHMTDMAGEWLYSDRYEIESDLGMSLENYDFLSNLRDSILKLKEYGYTNFSNFSAQETAALCILGV